MEWADQKCRCSWASPKNERYIRYHDEEWGIPVRDDSKLLEMLILESFQAGLSWECILNKREAFRQAFDQFDLEKICTYDDKKLFSLQNNADIIRNRLKIQAAVKRKGGLRKGENGIAVVRYNIQRLKTPRDEICRNNHYLFLSTSSGNYLFP